MEHRYDTVIIGAGPAGMACAVTMQHRGARLCVIDRAVFPRKKACAGLVTAKTYKLIKLLCGSKDINKLFCAKSSNVRLFRKNELLVEAPLENAVRLVDREVFDNALVNTYKALGGTIIEGVGVIHIDYENNRIRLANGDSVTYRNLIFADGALSRARKLLNVNKTKMAIGIEAFIPAKNTETDFVDLYFDYLADGYAWAFPHGDTICVGAACSYEKRVNYREVFDNIIADMGYDPAGAKYIGAFLPYGLVMPQEDLPDNVILIGDAGGFTDPISGEGLYMAMRTGILAAKAVLTPDPKKNYLDSVQPLTRIIKDGKKVQKTFYAPAVQKIFYRKVKDNKKAVSFFFEHQVENYGYEYRRMSQLYRDYKKS